MEKNVARNSWVDNLRSFITVLVVAHHSALAYTTFAWFNKKLYIASTHPVVDEARWKGLDIFVFFNDIFFMSLMFLISGIFMMHSLQQKQVKIFIRDRFFRLFVPFMIGVTLLMLLAYYPAFHLAYGSTNVKDYIIDFFTVEAWPVGPPWFIWVLFLFNVIFALCYPFLKNAMNKAGVLLASQRHSPLKLLLIWYVFTWVVYA
jgi:glucan biosynthesis protein C